MARQTHIEISFEIDNDGTPFYLVNSDGDLTDDPSKAVSFRLRAIKTGLDAINVDRRVMELADRLEAVDPADKLRPWIDLNRGIDGLQQAVQTGLEARLWPNGKPQAIGAGLREQRDLYNAAWSTLGPGDGELFLNRERWRALIQQRAWLMFLAEWYVMLEAVVVNGEPVKDLLADFRDLASTGVGGAYGAQLSAQYETALEVIQKKRMPS